MHTTYSRTQAIDIWLVNVPLPRVSETYSPAAPSNGNSFVVMPIVGACVRKRADAGGDAALYKSFVPESLEIKSWTKMEEFWMSKRGNWWEKEREDIS